MKCLQCYENCIYSHTNQYLSQKLVFSEIYIKCRKSQEFPGNYFNSRSLNFLEKHPGSRDGNLTPLLLSPDAGPKPHGQKPQGIYFFLVLLLTLY